MQQARGGVEIPYRSRLNLRVRGVDWPLFAIIGGLGTGLSFLVIVIQTPSIRYAGLGWLLIGFLFYVVYRRRVIHAPLTETVRAPIEFAPAAALEYHSVLVPVACDYLSLVGVRQVIRTVKNVNQLLHHPVQIWGVLPTFYDARARICREALATMRDHFGDRCLDPIRAAMPEAAGISAASGWRRRVSL